MAITVSTEWLDSNLDNPDFHILDATFMGLDPTRDAAQEFCEAHIPGARFLDLASLCDRSSPYPFMMPTAEDFAERMASLGIARSDKVILYDNASSITSSRAWWMFDAFGQGHNAAILEGGLPLWKAEGRRLASGFEPVTPVDRETYPPATGVRSLDELLENCSTRREQVVDARYREGFPDGKGGKFAGFIDGHIPGSFSLPFTDLVDENRCWKPEPELRAAFDRAGIDLSRPIIATCGAGVAAATIVVAARKLGMRDITLYDGSWSEWGSRPDTPKQSAG